MITMSIDEMLKATKGELFKDGKEYEYESITTDTRKLSEKCIFIALKGDNFNGNEFAVKASKQGAVICIVDEICFEEKELQSNTTIIKVKDTKRALMDLAKCYRSKLKLKIIGVTGSTGKTSTKDIIAAILSAKFKVFKTKGNFNNEIGLPLMIFSLDNSYDVAVLEMGMNHFNEIHNLADIARPDIAIITNIGISHIENLKSRENILKAKMEITDFFQPNNVLIVNAENDLLSTIKDTSYNLVRIGVEGEFEYSAKDICLNEDSVCFKIQEKSVTSDESLCVEMPGRHTILNTLLAVACARNLAMDFQSIQEGATKLEATSRRLDIIRTNGYIVIDDCYNASPDSMKAAIDVMKNINGSRRIAVLGTMKELGEEAYNCHLDVAKYAAINNVDILIAIGEQNAAFKAGFNNIQCFKGFSTCEEASEYILRNIKSEDIILIKASRAMKFETIVEKLKC